MGDIYIEFRRHSLKGEGAFGDMISPAGMVYARKIGAEHMRSKGFNVVVTTPMIRTAQTAAAFCEGAGDWMIRRDIIAKELWPANIDRWVEVCEGGKSRKLEDLLVANHRFIEEEARVFEAGLCEALKQVRDGENVLVVAHSPIIETLVYGLTGDVIKPLKECEGVLVACVRVEEAPAESRHPGIYGAFKLEAEFRLP